MEVDPETILKHVKSQARYKGEVEEYWKSMRKLPDYDYSKFYSMYGDYADKILQGDGIKDLKFIHLPDEEVSNGMGLIFSSSCDIEQENERKFPTRIVYAPLMKVQSYVEMLENAEKEDDSGNPTGEKLYTKEGISMHIDEVRKQRINQIFYLPPGQYLEEEAMVFFDNLCSASNDSILRENLSETRTFSLSAYGWHIFLERLSHFFTRLTEETVELRLKTTN